MPLGVVSAARFADGRTRSGLAEGPGPVLTFWWPGAERKLEAPFTIKYKKQVANKRFAHCSGVSRRSQGDIEAGSQADGGEVVNWSSSLSSMLSM